jgi:putative flippase GtrA
MSSEETEAGIQAATGLSGWPRRTVWRILMLLPASVRAPLLRRREVLKFLIVGGTCFLVAFVVNYALKLTVLTDKPVTALMFATVVSTVLSYILNREWAFRTRGGLERRHEAALFFGINAVAMLITAMPLWIARYVFELRVPEVSRLVQEVSDFAFGIVIGTLLAMTFRLWAYRKWVFPRQNVRLVRSAPDRAA